MSHRRAPSNEREGKQPPRRNFFEPTKPTPPRALGYGGYRHRLGVDEWTCIIAFLDVRSICCSVAPVARFLGNIFWDDTVWHHLVVVWHNNFALTNTLPATMPSWRIVAAFHALASGCELVSLPRRLTLTKTGAFPGEQREFLENYVGVWVSAAIPKNPFVYRHTTTRQTMYWQLRLRQFGGTKCPHAQGAWRTGGSVEAADPKHLSHGYGHVYLNPRNGFDSKFDGPYESHGLTFTWSEDLAFVQRNT